MGNISTKFVGSQYFQRSKPIIEFKFNEFCFLPDQVKQAFVEKLNQSFKNEQRSFFFRGLRFITPYRHKEIIKIDNFYVGKSIDALLSSGKMKEPIEFFQQALEGGKLRVNDQQIDNSYIIKKYDTLSYIVHLKREPPIYNNNIQIIYENDHIIIINKPVTMPLYSTRMYRKNNLFQIMRDAQQYPPLMALTNIDRSTSGIVIAAKQQYNYYDQKSFQQNFKKDFINQNIVARVEGLFPQQVQEIDIPNDQEYHKEEQSQSQFKDKNSQTSLIQFKIQNEFVNKIRQVLEEIGYPIVNDLSHKAKFIGNMWLQNIQKQFDDSITTDYWKKINHQVQQTYDQIMEQQSIMEDQRQGFHSSQNKIDFWDINKRFEIFLHHESMELQEKQCAVKYTTDDVPYWYDANQIVPHIK